MILDGKNAIITGARRGIGRATVEVFAKEGANIWACLRSSDQAYCDWLRTLEKRHSVSICPLYFDLVDPDGVKKAFLKIKASKTPVDILVNNAGTADESSSFMMTPMEKIRAVMEVNFIAQMQMTQFAARLMSRQQKGSIVNTASIAAYNYPEAGQLEYVASKAAVIGATRKLAQEFAEMGIRVNAIAPGIAETDMGDLMAQLVKDDLLGRTALSRLGKPEEIARAIAFLASDYSSYITGQILYADGGLF